MLAALMTGRAQGHCSSTAEISQVFTSSQFSQEKGLESFSTEQEKNVELQLVFQDFRSNIKQRSD